MNGIPVLVALVGALLPIASGESISLDKTPEIGIFMHFDAEPSSVSFSEMQNEASHLMDSAGLRLSWRFIKNNKGRESFSDLLVVRFKGSCSANVAPVRMSAAAPFKEVVTLASTQVVDGRVLPFTEVECDQVRRTLGDNEIISERQQQSEFGRALGRVLAHELYHLLAQTIEHTRNGVAKATHDWRDMGSKGLRFQDGETRAMRQGVLRHSMSFTPTK